MILYVVRHGIAAPADLVKNQPDRDRPLTDKGRKRMRQIAAGLLNLNVELDLILASPYLRTQQTARVLLKSFGLSRDQLVLTDNLAPEGDPNTLIKEIRESHGRHESFALVGHEPYSSGLISMLVAGDPTLSIILKRGGVCKLSADSLRFARCATLEWLLAPAQLVSIARS